MELKIETLVAGLCQEQQNQNESVIPTSSSASLATNLEGPSGSAPPPPQRLHPRVVKAMSKFTGVLKHKVVEYIRLLKQVEEPAEVLEEHGWIYTFINALGTDVVLNKLDVLIWIKQFPEIFTPQVVSMLKDYCNKIQQVDADNNAAVLWNCPDSDSDEEVVEMTLNEYFEYVVTNEVTQADVLALK